MLQFKKSQTKLLFPLNKTFYPKNTYMLQFLNTLLIYFGHKFLPQIQPVNLGPGISVLFIKNIWIALHIIQYKMLIAHYQKLN